jgi:hypothetical protein
MKEFVIITSQNQRLSDYTCNKEGEPMLLGFVWPIVLILMFAAALYFSTAVKWVLLALFLVSTIWTIRSRYRDAYIWFVGMGVGLVVFGILYPYS